MKPIAVLSLVFLSWQRSFAQEEPIPLGTRHQIFSSLMMEQRTFSVYLPASYSRPAYSKTGYPLFFVLDGLGLHFQSVSQFRKAAELFLLNIQYYPGSPEAHANYAGCQQALGDRNQAIEFYTRSLTLKEQPEIRKKLEALIRS